MGIHMQKNEVGPILHAINKNPALTDVYWIFHPTTVEYTFCSSAHGTSSRIDYMLGHKTNPNRFKNINIIQSVFFEDIGEICGIKKHTFNQPMG